MVKSGLLPNKMVAGILRVVDRLSGSSINPVIGNETMLRWIGTGEEGGVANGSFGIGMPVVRIAVVCSAF